MIHDKRHAGLKEKHHQQAPAEVPAGAAAEGQWVATSYVLQQQQQQQ
jgi:hypothetical protein